MSVCTSKLHCAAPCAPVGVNREAGNVARQTLPTHDTAVLPDADADAAAMVHTRHDLSVPGPRPAHGGSVGCVCARRLVGLGVLLATLAERRGTACPAV